MPAAWLQPLAHEEHEGSSPADAMECFLAREREQLQSAFLELAGESRRSRICGDVTDYLTFLTTTVDTTGSVADARGALGFLASVNGGGDWDKESRRLAARGHEAATCACRRKGARTAGEAGARCSAELRLLGGRRPDGSTVASDYWRRNRMCFQAFGKVRRHAPHDEGFRVHDTYIYIFVSERKTHVYGGQWIDFARPFDGSFGVFDALLLGKSFRPWLRHASHRRVWARAS